MIHPALTHTSPPAPTPILMDHPTLAVEFHTTSAEPNHGRQHIVGVSKTAYGLATPGCLD
jgi:hypothetical protein